MPALLTELWRIGAATFAFARYVFVRFFDDRCPQVASSLSFTTMLAAVPVMAVGLAVAAKLPYATALRNEMQRFLLLNFVPQVGEAVDRNFDVILTNAASLTTFGLAGLVVSGFAALVTIHGAFDQIWRVGVSHSILWRALVSFLVLCIGPELVGLGLIVPKHVLMLASAAGFADWAERVAGLLVLLPPSLEIVGLGTVYLLLPRSRVRFREAVTGAITAMLLLELGKYGFARYVANFADYQAVYGALSVLPVLLLWVYLAWLAVLFGAVVAASLPEWGEITRRP
jgi:membrane protein